MKIKSITNYLLKQYPLSLQEEWDESGFLNKCDLTKETKKVFVCLDLNEKTIDEAIKQDAKLVISHHPIFTKNKDHELSSFNRKLISKIKKAKITVLSLHTCFDNSNQGMNFLIGTKLKLRNLKWYKGAKFVVGNFAQALTVKQIAALFKKTFGVSLLTTNANANDKYSTIGICAGAGLSVFAEKFDELSKKNILLITGDIKHHGWQDLANYKIDAIDVGHDLENCFSAFIASLVKQKFPTTSCLAITTCKKEKSI
ncbi:MAG: Nif3-like dinuclear metal center hexameric protein [Mycoplasma sp.]|nr:Nif3-like dinuclear metal center hexameric protein [Candidatus Hennigella equi]